LAATAGSECDFAQEPQVSPQAMTQLLEQHYRHLKTLQAVFLQRYSEGEHDARVESGTVYFKRPGRMRWDYESPEKKLFIADGKTVWFYVPYDHTVTKAPVKESSDWRTPLALLTGKVDLSRLCSRIELVTQRGIPSGHVVLRCLPKGQEKPEASGKVSGTGQPAGLPGAEDFTDVLLEMDSGSGELARIEIRQPGDVHLEYRFGKWQTDIPLADSLFRFQVPVGVAVVDGAAMANGSR
jgi:outer membrane lipoprotein carrier protein